MTRKKVKSRVVEKAELRSYGLRAIDPNMDFGNARNLPNLIELIKQYRIKVNAYNTALAVLDSSNYEIKELEKQISDLSNTMLLGVAFKYGKDSSEYETAGGVRKSERIRRSSKTRLTKTAEETAVDNAKTA